MPNTHIVSLCQSFHFQIEEHEVLFLQSVCHTIYNAGCETLQANGHLLFSQLGCLPPRPPVGSTAASEPKISHLSESLKKRASSFVVQQTTSGGKSPDQRDADFKARRSMLRSSLSTNAGQRCPPSLLAAAEVVGDKRPSDYFVEPAEEEPNRRLSSLFAGD